MPRYFMLFIVLSLQLPSTRAVGGEGFWDFWQAVQLRHPEIKALNADKEAAESRSKAALGPFFPKVSTQARYLLETQDYAEASQKNKGTEFSVTAEQSIFDLKAWNEHGLASTEAELDGLLIYDRMSELRLTILQSYWHAVIRDERRKIFQKIYQPLIKKIGSQGEIALLESLRSRHEQTQWLLGFSQMQLQAMQIQDDLESQLDRMKSWAAWDDLKLPNRKSSFRPDAKWLEKIPQTLDESTTVLQLAELTQKKHQYRLKQSYAGFLPRFFLFAAWQGFNGTSEIHSNIAGLNAQESIPQVNRGSSYGVAMQWTLFEGLGNVHDSKSSSASLDAATQRLQGTQASQAMNFKDQQRRLRSALERFRLLVRLRDESQNGLLAIMKQQNAGLQSFDAILPPLNRAYEAETLYFQAMLDFFDLYWKILRDLGKLDDSSLKTFADQALETVEKVE